MMWPSSFIWIESQGKPGCSERPKEMKKQTKQRGEREIILLIS